jgi:hypothetical protein
MITTAKTILAFAANLPEGATISAKELLHLGERAAVDQALSRLVKRGQLLRVRRGVFAVQIVTRFGKRAPSVSAVVENIARTTGEMVTESGAIAANRLGLSTQNPVRRIYWTSGRSRHLKLGAQTVELRHVPAWQVQAPQSRAGRALRAMAWIGKSEAGQAMAEIKTQLSHEERQELFNLRGSAPTWLAKELSVLAIQ